MASSEPRTSFEKLDRHLARGVGWTFFGKWATQFFTWLSLLALARLLTAADFGIFGMTTIYVGLLVMISEVGGAAVLAQKLTPDQLSQLNLVSAGFGLLGILVSVAAGPWLARFFHTPQLLQVIVAMSAGFLLSSLRILPYSRLQKDLQFKTLSAIEVAQSLVQSATTLALAWFRFGYWALVAGSLAGALTATALSIAARPLGFAWPRWRSLAGALALSTHVLVSRISWYAYSNTDFIIVGRRWGSTLLGTYTMAWDLAGMPGEKITSLIMRVSTPLFANLQDDPAAIRRYLLRLTEITTVITLPAVFGLALVAGDAVGVALGRQWAGAVAPLRWLALYAALRTFSAFLPQILVVTGEARFTMRVSIFSLFVVGLSLLAGSHWGISGVAAAWSVSYPVTAIPYFRRTFRRIGMPVSDYLRALEPAGVACAAMAMAVLLFAGSGAAWPPAVRLASEIAAGAAAYFAVLGGLYRERTLAYLRFARSLAHREPASFA